MNSSITINFGSLFFSYLIIFETKIMDRIKIINIIANKYTSSNSSLKNQIGKRIINDAIVPGNTGIYPIPHPEQINL